MCQLKMAKPKDLTYSEKIVNSLRAGLNSAFREAEKSVIQDNIDFLAKEILENEEYDDKTRNDLRRWHSFLTWFIRLPEEIIRSAEKMPDVPSKDYDPFQKVFDGITKNGTDS